MNGNFDIICVILEDVQWVENVKVTGFEQWRVTSKRGRDSAGVA